MAMTHNVKATLTLDATDLVFLEDSLQRDAVGMLRAGSKIDDPAYVENRQLFIKVWDALYA